MYDGGYFRLEEQVAETLDNYKYRAIRLDKGEIEFISDPKIGSDGTTQTIHMVLEIKEFMVERKLHPIASVDARPRLHRCGYEGQCEYKQSNGGCTLNPVVHGGGACKHEESDYDET